MKFNKTNLFKQTLLLSLTNMALFAAPSGFYIEAGGGLSLNDAQKTKSVEYVYNNPYYASLSLGYQANLFRFELEEKYIKTTLYSATADGSYSVSVDGDFTSNSHMINGYYSGYNNTNLSTSFGLGVGLTDINLDDSIKNSSIFSAQGVASVGYQISESLLFVTKYTYMYISKSDDFQAKSENQISITLRYLF